jgi:hypothetical protein
MVNQKMTLSAGKVLLVVLVYYEDCALFVGGCQLHRGRKGRVMMRVVVVGENGGGPIRSQSFVPTTSISSSL